MDVRGPPRVLVVAPWVRPGLDRDEAVAPVVVGEAATGAGEVRVERRRVPVDVMVVAARGVRLPDLDQRAAQRAAVLVEHAAADDDPLAERLARVLARQVVVELGDRIGAEHGAVGAVGVLRQGDERPVGRAPARRAVAGIVDLHLGPERRIVR